MTDINKLIEIIKGNGNSASFDKIIDDYQIKHHFLMQAEHKSLVLKTLQKNSSEVSFNEEAQKWELRIKSYATKHYESELSKIVNSNAFEKAFKHFIEQANVNAISKRSEGEKVPYGFKEKLSCDGAEFGQHYGQGAASLTPYMNWHVVSIYYLPQTEDIFIGIEENRYAHINEISIKPLRCSRIGNKQINTAIYYSTSKNNIVYSELYDNFIQLCEEVIQLGLE